MTSSAVDHIYPETRAGGYCRVDHRMHFLVRVNSLLEPGMVVLDYGAGRGKWAEDTVPLRRRLGQLRGRCAEVIGADMDPAVLGNPQLDRAVLLTPEGRLPLADASVDLIVAFAVFEHVASPDIVAGELTRVLKPGGSICGWTPNRHGYVGVGARLVPRRLHAALLRRLEPRRQEEDSFPPLYRMNSRRALRRLFPPSSFLDCSYRFDGQPFYHFERPAIAMAWRALFSVLPPPLKGFHVVLLQKRPAG